MYICKYRGREFEKQQSYASHTGKCKLKPNHQFSMGSLLTLEHQKLKSRYKMFILYSSDLASGRMTQGESELIVINDTWQDRNSGLLSLLKI